MHVGDCVNARVNWVLDSGSSHMIKEKFVLNGFHPVKGDVFLAGMRCVFGRYDKIRKN